MILVTGGAIRLGRAISLALANQGHTVLVHYNRHEKEAKELGFPTIQGDFNQLDDFIARCPKEITGIVHNVGNYQLGKGSENLEPLLQSNLLAPIKLTEALQPSIQAAKGTIVFLGTSGLNNAWTRAVPYGITKSALLFYMKSLAKQLAPYEVNVNMVSPGQLEISEDLPENLPMKRPGSCSEVAQFVASLFSPESHYITGQNIEMSGGY